MKQLPVCLDKDAVDLCKENMKKRRMLFQRDQAEKKDISDTSVNNTMINESGLNSLIHSRDPSICLNKTPNKVGIDASKRESEISASSCISEIS